MALVIGHRGVAGPGRGKKMFGPQQQEQIRAMVRAGKSTRYIAARLGCSPATVVNYAGTEPRPGELRQYLVKLGAGL